MRVQHLTPADATTLSNPRVRSEQLLWPRNAPEAAVTMTRVTMRPGAVTPRHRHPGSEQVWVVEQGTATLLLEGDETAPVRTGDVVRTPAGEVHGLANTGAAPFVYLTATTPPIDLTGSYRNSAEGAERGE